MMKHTISTTTISFVLLSGMSIAAACNHAFVYVRQSIFCVMYDCSFAIQSCESKMCLLKRLCFFISRILLTILVVLLSIPSVVFPDTVLRGTGFDDDKHAFVVFCFWWLDTDILVESTCVLFFVCHAFVYSDSKIMMINSQLLFAPCMQCSLPVFVEPMFSSRCCSTARMLSVSLFHPWRIS